MQSATIMYEQGELNKAVKLLQDLISDQPGNDVLYSATAVLQWKNGQIVIAKKTLLQGYEAVDGNSAEISYNLGLVSLELGELDEAVRYAQQAYDLGFPLPGLRVKLEKIGRM